MYRYRPYMSLAIKNKPGYCANVLTCHGNAACYSLNFFILPRNIIFVKKIRIFTEVIPYNFRKLVDKSQKIRYNIKVPYRDVAKRLRHQTLTLALVSSNLAIPARKTTSFERNLSFFFFANGLKIPLFSEKEGDRFNFSQ